MNSRVRTRTGLLIAAVAAPLLSGCITTYRVPTAPTPAEIPALEAQLAASGSSPEVAIRLAQAYRSAQRYEDARVLLERVASTAPDASNATFLLGVTYEDLGRYADARRLYREYIEEGGSAELREQLESRLPLLQRLELQASVRDAIARETELANTPPTPYTVAVFPFQFVGADPQLRPLGRALAELLVSDLAQTSRLQVLERAQVQLLLDELELGQSGAVEVSTAARTGRILGAERIVHGSVDGGEPALQLETTIVRVTENAWPGEAAPAAETPRQIQLTEQDQLGELMDMQNRLALRIYSSLGVELTPAERERVTQRPTENVMALVAYGLGLEAADAGNLTEAAQHFQQAAALDPSFAAAAASAAQVSAAAAAASVGTAELAARTETESEAPEQGEFLTPAITRDPAAEILGTEGLARSTILELIIRRP